MTQMAISVWKDGSHKLWKRLDATYAEADANYLVTIALPLEVCPADIETLGTFVVGVLPMQVS